MLHNDEPTLNDQLDRVRLVQEVGDAIAKCSPPQVFGIHGDWGLGKTSFLHQIQLYLTGKCPQQPEVQVEKANVIRKGVYDRNVQAVWFDAWRYQHEAVPIVALLHEMRSQLSWGQRRMRSAKRSREIAMRGALLSIEELTKKIGIQYSKFRDASREWDSSHLAADLPSHTLREHLREAIGQLLRGAQSRNAHQSRLVVFIDDIDRCEPDVAYKLLEALKIYLTLDNCVFVLGMNQKAVEEAISTKMGLMVGPVKTEGPNEESRLKYRASAYMEKLCQNIWQLPAVRDPGQVLQKLLKSTVHESTAIEWIKSAVDEPNCLPPNPRRLKGLANLLGRLTARLPLDSNQLDTRAGVIEARMLVVVAYIYQFHIDLYVRWQADVNFYNQILDCCEGVETGLPVLDSLVMPEQKVVVETEAVPSATTQSTYPDPTQSDVFWIQTLILTLGTEVSPEQFEPYLHGRAK